MSIIEASSGTYRSRVDGTIVLSVEIEPRHRAAALALFGMPGTPLAIAALKPASSKPEPKAEERPAIGELGRWAAIRCTEQPFQKWIRHAHPTAWAEWCLHGSDEEVSAAIVRTLCGVESRRDIDTNPEAFDKLHRLVRIPYSQWLKANPQ